MKDLRAFEAEESTDRLARFGSVVEGAARDASVERWGGPQPQSMQDRHRAGLNLIANSEQRTANSEQRTANNE
jgi:hypothetical protein